MAVLHRASDFPDSITPQHPHENRARRLSAARAADEKTFAPCGKGQYRQEDKARIALARRQGEAAPAVTEHECLRWALIVFHVVVRADDGGVDDPEIGLAEFFIQRRRARVLSVALRGDRTAI